MTELIRNLTKIYETDSYQTMKTVFEEAWKNSGDWAKEERFGVGFFAIRMMIVKKDYELARNYLTKLQYEDSEKKIYVEQIAAYDEILKAKEEENAKVESETKVNEAKKINSSRKVSNCRLLNQKYISSIGGYWCSIREDWCPYTDETVNNCNAYESSEKIDSEGTPETDSYRNCWYYSRQYGGLCNLRGKECLRYKCSNYK